MTKFNPAWQLVRVQARKMTNYKDKIKHVMSYLEQNPNQHDWARVANWLKMTAAGYKKSMPEAALAFLNTREEIFKNKDLYNLPKDNSSILDDLTFEELQMVLNDLETRKYDFQFNKTPQAHIDFVEELKKHINKHHSA